MKTIFDAFISEAVSDYRHTALYFLTIGELDLDGYIQTIDPSSYIFRVWLYEKFAKEKPRNEYVDIRVEMVEADNIYNIIDYTSGKNLLSTYKMNKSDVNDLRTDLDPIVSKKLENIPTINKLIE